MSSREIASLSPTLYANLELCRLRVAFGQQHGARLRGRQTVAAVLGQIAHGALESVMESYRTNDDRSLTQLWDREVETAVATLAKDHQALANVSPERWPNYELARARVGRVFERLTVLVAACGDAATILAEHDLSSSDGLLTGRADIVVRGREACTIVDFKTGAIRDQFGNIRREYRRQVLLYAYLEHEETGFWPGVVYLIPLEGLEAAIAVDPVEAESIAQDARTMLDTYNLAVPGPQPANPGEAECRYCPFTANCEAFWSSCSEWTKLRAVRGRIARVARGQVPAVTIALDDVDGFPPGEIVLIRSIDLYEHPVVDHAVVGHFASLVGLIDEATRGSFRLAPWGRIEIRN